MPKLSEIYTVLTLKDKDYELKIRKATKTTQTFAQRIQSRFDRLNFRKFLYGSVGIYALYRGLKAISTSFIGAADTMEQYKMRLEVLLRSQSEGARMFKLMSDYAARVPHEYKDVMWAATTLSGVMKGGVDEVARWIPLIGDLAAAVGYTIQQTTGQIVRMYSAGAATADLFREKGTLAMLGFQAGVSYSAQETRKRLFQEWTKVGSQWRGATKKLATTWLGLMSMLKDAWLQFRYFVMRSGVFDFLKDKIKMVIDKINDMKKTGEFDELAQTFSDKVVGGLEKIWQNRDKIVDVFESIRWASKQLMASIEGWRLIGGLYKNYGITEWKKDFFQAGVGLRYGTKKPAFGTDIFYQRQLEIAYKEQQERIIKMRREVFAKTPAIHKGTYTPPAKPYIDADWRRMFMGKGFAAPVIPQYAGAYPRLGAFPGAGLGMKRTMESQLLSLQTGTKTATDNIAKHWETLSWSMQSSWSYALTRIEGRAYNFKNVMEGICDGIKQSFNRMVADMVAERLWERTFAERSFLGDAIETGLSLIGLGKKETPSEQGAGKAALGNNVYVKVEGPSADAIVGIVYEDMDRNGLLSR